VPRIVTPAGYATLVAEDRERAQQFAELLANGDRTRAGHYVAEAAEEILGYCQDVASGLAGNVSYLSALSNIEKVGRRSVRKGDDIQARWCAYLELKLRGK